MLTRIPRWHLATILAAIALALTGITAGPVAAQDDESVLLRAFACPHASPTNPFSECDAMVGATFRIEANGSETAESPVTILADVGIGPGAGITVPAGADLTITLLSGAPDGYVPAAGFDPFSANVEDLPQVGTGGESTGPGVTFITVPGDTSGGDDSGDDDGSGDSSSGTTTLPETGAGVTAPDAGHRALPIALLLAAATLFGAGVATRRSHAS